MFLYMKGLKDALMHFQTFHYPPTGLQSTCKCCLSLTWPIRVLKICESPSLILMCQWHKTKLELIWRWYTQLKFNIDTQNRLLWSKRYIFQSIDARIWVFPHSILPQQHWRGKNTKWNIQIGTTTTTMKWQTRAMTKFPRNKFKKLEYQFGDQPPSLILWDFFSFFLWYGTAPGGISTKWFGKFESIGLGSSWMYLLVSNGKLKLFWFRHSVR